MYKKYLTNALLGVCLLGVSSLSHSVDLTVDIDDKDLDRVEGWISEFPPNIRKQMEVLLESDALSNTVSESINKLTAGMQCVNSQLRHTGGVVLGSTVLSKQKFSNECIRSIGEVPPRFWQLFGTGQVFGIKQQYHLEKCSLSEFADRNGGREDYLENVLLKAEIFKTAGYAAFCHNGNNLIDPNTGKLMLLESTDRENAWAELKRRGTPCNSLESCWEYNLGRLNELVTKYADCGFVMDRDLVAERDQLKAKIDMDRSPASLTFGVYESYSLIRLLSTRQSFWNRRLLNTFKRDCDTYDAPPTDPKSIVGYNSSTKLLLTKAKSGKKIPEAEYMKKKELGEFCVDASVQDFFNNHYTKINYDRVELGVCGQGKTTVTDCSGHIEEKRTGVLPTYNGEKTVEDGCD